MDEFAKLLAMLQNPGDDGPGETIYDDLNATYTTDVGSRDGKIAQLEESNATLMQENIKLKGQNYDLMMQLQGDNDEVTAEGENLDNDNDDTENAGGIDSLFDTESES